MAERGHTIAITHASVIRTAIAHVLGAPLAASWKIDIEPLSITDFRSDGRRWVCAPAVYPLRSRQNHFAPERRLGEGTGKRDPSANPPKKNGTARD